VRLGSCGATTDLPDRCAPSRVSYALSHVYADDACTTPILLATNTDPLACTQYQTPSFIAPDDTIQTLMVESSTPTTQCPTGWTTSSYFTIDTTSTVPPFFVGPGPCEPAAQSTANVYMAGAEIPLSSMPEIAHVTDGAGRLRARVQTAVNGERLFVEGFADTELATTCSATIAEDGVLRCLPDTAYYPEYMVVYADAQCTTPIYVDIYGGCGTQAFARQLLDDNGQYTMRIVQRGDAIAPPATIYEDFGPGRCNAGGVASTSTFFSATIVPPESFAPLTDTTL
jgi:hypothetical protein